jgi:sec-independent protein translocase protein TatA
MFGGIGMWEIVLIFLVVLLLFGAKRLPEIGSSLGKGIREFKGSLREIETELKLPEERKDTTPALRRSADVTEGGEPRRLTSSHVERAAPAPSEPSAASTASSASAEPEPKLTSSED